MRCSGWLINLLLVGALSACGSTKTNDDGGPPDATTDSGADSAADSGTDSGTDSGADSGPSGACLNPADTALFAGLSTEVGAPPGVKTGDQAVTAALQECIGNADDAKTKEREGCVSFAVDLLSGATPEKINALNECLRSCAQTIVGAVSTGCMDCFIEVTTCGAQNCVGDCFCLTQDLCCMGTGNSGCTPLSNCNMCLMGNGVISPGGPNCVANFTACTGLPETLFVCEDDPALCDTST